MFAGLVFPEVGKMFFSRREILIRSVGVAFHVVKRKRLNGLPGDRVQVSVFVVVDIQCHRCLLAFRVEREPKLFGDASTPGIHEVEGGRARDAPSARRLTKSRPCAIR